MGKHRLRGAYLLNPIIEDNMRLDSKLGIGFCIFTQGGTRPMESPIICQAVRERWASLGTKLVHSPNVVLGGVDTSDILIVRPDRRICAVADANSFGKVSRQIFQSLGNDVDTPVKGCKPVLAELFKLKEA